MTIRVGLLAGFDEGPFYYFVESGRRSNHSVEEAAAYLGLSSKLATDLTQWDAEYQAIYDASYPPDSKFPTPEAEFAWIERGKELAARIKQESPMVSIVDYQADGYYANGTCVF